MRRDNPKLKKYQTKWVKKLYAGTANKQLNSVLEKFSQMNDADKVHFSLGGNLYKLRVASKTGRGKRGGSRVILAYNTGDAIFCLYGFDKNEASNITNKQCDKLKVIGNAYLNASDEMISSLLKKKELWEITNE